MLGQVLALKLGGILLLAWMMAIHLAWERVLYINHSSVFQFELELVMDLYLCTSICLLCLNCCYWSQLINGHKLPPYFFLFRDIERFATRCMKRVIIPMNG